jgi:hypothetical protein
MEEKAPFSSYLEEESGNIEQSQSTISRTLQHRVGHDEKFVVLNCYRVVGTSDLSVLPVIANKTSACPLLKDKL